MKRFLALPLLGLLSLWLVAAVFAQPIPDELPERPTLTPTATLLPINTPAPTPVATTIPSAEGGLIILDASSAPIPLAQNKTIVQWQNEAGDWFDVTGWQGELNQQKQVVWWVAPQHLGQSPFRWLIFRENNQVLTSPSFTLPTSGGQIIRLQVDSTWQH
ncbi:MAG: hypothetical protein OT477_12200 [Chloroflexi bacterium]|nr:hypothetical protein [Chloroflexota bacterium]